MAKTDENVTNEEKNDSTKESAQKAPAKASSKIDKAPAEKDAEKVIKPKAAAKPNTSKDSPSKSASKKSSSDTAKKTETNTVKAAKKEDFAVIQTGAKQYIVKTGTVIDIEKIAEGEKTVTFDSVLLVSDGKTAKIGQPFVEGAKVKASILDQKRDGKKIVFKFKRKTGYKRTQGHRQSLTTIKIDSISG